MELINYNFIDFLIAIVLALIMLGIGLALSFADIKVTLLNPKALITGLLIQMIGAPVIIYLMLSLTNMSIPLKIGFIILSACPGGTTSSFVVYFFRCNVALSVALTTINSILALFSIPMLVNISIFYFRHQEIEIYLPFLASVFQIFLITILPASIGLFIRYKNKKFADKVQETLKYIMLFLLAMVFCIKFFAGKDIGGTGININDIKIILPFGLIFHLASFLAGYYFSRIGGQSYINATTIAIEVALHNTTLAFLVAGSLLQNQDMVKPSLVYSLFSFFITFLYSFIFIQKMNLRNFLKLFKR